jgi:ankyrin repeat protein
LTPLLYAARENCLACVDVLVKAGGTSTCRIPTA